MKHNVYVYFATAILALYACSQPQQKTETPTHETPEVLQEKTIEKQITSSFSSEYKRTTPNIIEDLFNEALDKNADLKKIFDAINILQNMKKDSLFAYNKYVSANENYYTNVEELLSQITDSTLKHDLKKTFMKSKKKFNKSIEDHKISNENITTKQAELHNQQIALKLMVTHTMMQNYQKNELPKLTTIQHISEQYSDIITQVKKFN